MSEEPVPETFSFTDDQDWVTCHAPNWKRWLAPWRGQPMTRALEIGTWEGRSSKWFLDNILTGEEARLVSVDRHDNRFEKNRAAFETVYPKEFQQIVGDAFGYLKKEVGVYDFIYLDGPKDSAELLPILVMCWNRLKPGGVLIADDYGWPGDSDERTTSCAQNPPAVAIDCFCLAMRSKLQVLDKGWQVALLKK